MAAASIMALIQTLTCITSSTDASGDEKEDADFTRDLTNALSGHPAVKDTNTVTAYSWPLLHMYKEPLELMYVVMHGVVRPF